ncbi:MAG: hypothetical protein QM813_01520 [Verrucomicrobiota bacterium]
MKSRAIAISRPPDKEESMEICFVPDNNYGGFLQQANLVQKTRGEIVAPRRWGPATA